ALALAPPLADSMHPLAEADHRDEEQADEQHDQDHVLPVGDRVEDQAYGSSLVGVLVRSVAVSGASNRSLLTRPPQTSTLAKCLASARSTSDGSGRPPSQHAASTQASPSPRSPVARRAAQREISSAIAATASTPPASAIRTRPCA